MVIDAAHYIVFCAIKLYIHNMWLILEVVIVFYYLVVRYAVQTNMN